MEIDNTNQSSSGKGAIAKLTLASSYLLGFSLGSFSQNNFSEKELASELQDTKILSSIENDPCLLENVRLPAIDLLQLPEDKKSSEVYNSQKIDLEMDLTGFGFEPASRLVWRDPKSLVKLTEIVEAQNKELENIPDFPQEFLKAHFKVMTLSDRLKADFPELSEALNNLRTLGFQAIQCAPELKEQIFDKFLMERSKIAVEFGFLPHLGLGMYEGQDMHSNAGLMVQADMEVEYNGEKSTFFFVSEPQIKARGYTIKNSAVINLAKNDTSKNLNDLRVTIIDELAHVYLAQHLKFDSYSELPWDTSQDGRPEAPVFVSSESLKKALANVPIVDHQHVDEFIAFSWSVKSEGENAILGGIENLLSLDVKSDSKEAQSDRYFLINRFTDLALGVIDDNRDGDLGIKEARQSIAEKHQTLMDTLENLAKKEAIIFSLDFLGHDTSKALKPFRDLLCKDLPDPNKLEEKKESIKAQLLEKDYKALDKLISDYEFTISNLLQIIDSIETIRSLTAEGSEEKLKIESDLAQKEWASSLSQNSIELLNKLTVKEKEQFKELIVLYGSYYESKIKEHFERNLDKQ